MVIGVGSATTTVSSNVKKARVFDLRHEGEHDRLFAAALRGGECVIAPDGRSYGISVARGRRKVEGNWRECTIIKETVASDLRVPLWTII